MKVIDMEKMLHMEELSFLASCLFAASHLQYEDRYYHAANLLIDLFIQRKIFSSNSLFEQTNCSC